MIAAPFFGIGATQLPTQRRRAAIDDRGEVLADRWTSPTPVPDVSCCSQNLLQQIGILQSAPLVFLNRFDCAFREICNASRCIDLRYDNCIQHSHAIGNHDVGYALISGAQMSVLRLPISPCVHNFHLADHLPGTSYLHFPEPYLRWYRRSGRASLRRRIGCIFTEGNCCGPSHLRLGQASSGAGTDWA